MANPEYCVELFDSSATFGPNVKQGEVWDARNLGWSRFDRLPGKAFLTLEQTSPILPLIVPLLTHVDFWRITPSGDTRVYRGFVIDVDTTGDDVIVSGYDYQSLLSISRSGFKTMYPTKMIGTEIVSPEWTAAKNATSSPLGFVTTGSIENPLGTDEATPITTNAQFGTLDQMRLQLFYDLSEMGRANTVHNVTYEIDLNNTFNFWRNKGTLSAIAFVLGGNVSDYHFTPGWTHYRNNLATIVVDPGTDALSELVSSDAAGIAAKGLRQDVTTLKTLAGLAGGTVVSDQQKAALDRELLKLLQQPSALSLQLMRGLVDPLAGWSIGDKVPVEVVNGADSITGTRRILGTETLYREGGEQLNVLVGAVAV